MSQKQYASFYIDDSLFGIDVRLIREINRNLDITTVDSAPPFVRGLLNLRGQIVTVIDVARRMGLRDELGTKDNCRCIVLKTDEELEAKRGGESGDGTGRDIVALYVDAIGDMVTIDESEIEKPPANIGIVEGRYISGVAKLENELLVILRVSELLALEEEKTGK